MKNFKKILIDLTKNSAPSFALAIALVSFAIISANLLYQTKPVIKRGFQIEISTDGKAVTKKEEKPVDFAQLIAIADINRGAKIFKKCASCHNIQKGEGAKVGPNLFGVVGRVRASFAGFNYSSAMKAKGGSWDRDSINQFITNPKEYVAGTKMTFAGLKKPQDRADVILFLEKQK